jgi:hypothetical protein
MKKLVGQECIVGSCPAIYEDGENLIIVGQKADEKEVSQLQIGTNETAVIIPKELLEKLPK